jgi:hypothetical protein
MLIEDFPTAGQACIEFKDISWTQVARNMGELNWVDLPKLPPELIGSFNLDDWFRIYINGVLYRSNLYEYSYNASTKEITFVFDGLPFLIESTDELGVTGKFIEL